MPTECGRYYWKVHVKDNPLEWKTCNSPCGDSRGWGGDAGFLNEIRQSSLRTINFHNNITEQSFSRIMFSLSFSKWRCKYGNSMDLVKVNVSNIGEIPVPQLKQFEISLIATGIICRGFVKHKALFNYRINCSA